MQKADRVTLVFNGHPMRDDKMFFADHCMLLPVWVQVFVHRCEFEEVTELAQAAACGERITLRRNGPGLSRRAIRPSRSLVGPASPANRCYRLRRRRAAPHREYRRVAGVGARPGRADPCGSFSMSSTTTTLGRKTRRDQPLSHSTGGPVQPDHTISPRTGEQKSEMARDSMPGVSYRGVGRMDGRAVRPGKVGPLSAPVEARS